MHSKKRGFEHGLDKMIKTLHSSVFFARDQVVNQTVTQSSFNYLYEYISGDFVVFLYALSSVPDSIVTKKKLYFT